MPEITTTNAQSYERPERCIRGANTEQENVRSNGESLSDWIREHDIPEVLSMEAAYREIAGRLNQSVRVGRPTSAEAREEDLYSFDALPSLDALAAAQGVQPIENIDDLVTDFWPEDESVEDFIAAATEGRHEEDEPDS